ncbi:MAG: FAD-dependent oxidoreductase [Pseudomonadota bacterium]
MRGRAIIVGAGAAGLTAALRLLQRGVDVELYEQNQFLGGMLGAHDDKVTGTLREHSYHMLPNWYVNFFRIAEEIGIQGNFAPREAFRFLGGPGLSDIKALYNPGGPQDFLRNLASGAAPTADMFLYMYSMIDMLAEPDHGEGLLDRYTINGFLHSRPYMTEAAARLHHQTWQTVWAISSFQASARSYRTFLRFANRVSIPELWLFNDVKSKALIEPWHAALEAAARESGARFGLHRGRELIHVEPDEDGRGVAWLEFREVQDSPSTRPRGAQAPDGKVLRAETAGSDVILALSPGAMKRLARGRLYEADPRLGDVERLEAEPMGCLQLCLTVRRTDLPDDITVLENGQWNLTFLDYSQLWPGQETTLLYVVASDVKPLLSVPDEPPRDPKSHELELDLNRPRSALEYVLRETLQALAIPAEQVDRRRTAFTANAREALFANLAGSWEWRPETRTKMANLFLAGCWVRNFADVATIEGAVISGLNAAEAVRARWAPNTPPVRVEEPETFPPEVYQALRAAWAPYAAAAKAWSEANRMAGGRLPDWGRWLGRRLAGRLGTAPNPPEYLGRLFWDLEPRTRWTGPERGVGPLYWNYGPDGRRKD